MRHLINMLIVASISNLASAANPPLPEKASPAATSSAKESAKGKIYYFGYSEGRPADPAGMIGNGRLQVNRVLDALKARPRFAGCEIKTSGGYDSLVSGINYLSRTAVDNNDTAVIYLHTHGGPLGLTVSRMRWTDLAERVLGIPAGNVLVFLATCNSGAGVGAFSNSGWDKRQAQNYAVFSIVSKSEQGTARPGPFPINPLSDNIILKINSITRFDGLADLPAKVRASYSAFGQERNPRAASSWKVDSRDIW
ncbi:MAG: hypothetical protein K9M45_05400 [Kiritimatiellales bacterium]|nr:hypothetical protein [Kiritimatiellales bacterium]